MCVYLCNEKHLNNKIIEKEICLDVVEWRPCLFLPTDTGNVILIIFEMCKTCGQTVMEISIRELSFKTG